MTAITVFSDPNASIGDTCNGYVITEVLNAPGGRYVWKEIATGTSQTSAATKNALSSLSGIPNGEAVKLLGYNEAGDGAGQDLIYHATGRSVVPIGNGWFFAGPGADDYFGGVTRSVVNVLQAGAYNDGTHPTETTAAIQALVAAVPERTTIWFPDGYYSINDTITINKHRIHFLGGGKWASQINFNPSSAKPCLLFTRAVGSEINYQCSLKGFAFAGSGTQQKIAIDLVQASEFHLADIAVLNWTGNSGSSSTPSIGLRTKGHDTFVANRLDIYADRPVHITKSATYPTLSADHFHMSNLLLSPQVGTESSILIDGDVGLNNLTLDGYQVWSGGKYGVRMLAGSPAAQAHSICVSNFRFEQPANNGGYAFSWEGSATNMLFDTGSFGGVTSPTNGGVYLRNVRAITFLNTIYTGDGVALNVDSTCDDIQFINTFFQDGSTVSMPGFEEQFGLNKINSLSPIAPNSFWRRIGSANPNVRISNLAVAGNLSFGGTLLGSLTGENIVLSPTTNAKGVRIQPVTGTNASFMEFANANGIAYIGVDSSTGGLTGINYATLINSSSTTLVVVLGGVQRFIANPSGLTIAGELSSSGAVLSPTSNTRGLRIAPIAGTNAAFIEAQNTGGVTYFGTDNSIGGLTGTPYTGFVNTTATSFQIVVAGVVRLNAMSTGVSINGILAAAGVTCSTLTAIGTISGVDATLSGLITSATSLITGAGAVAKSTDTSGATDAKKWWWQTGGAAGAGVMRLRAINDAETSGINAIEFTRTGIASITTNIPGVLTVGGILNFGGFTATNLGTPSTGTDATNKNYVDNAINGLNWKTACVVATTGNISLSGLQAIDGYTTLANDRVLVRANSTGSQNGIYLAASGAWSRAPDSDTPSEIDGSAVYIRLGTTLADTAWTETATVATLGTDTVSYTQIGSGATYTAGSSLTLVGNTFALSATPALGTPVSGNFASGVFTWPTFNQNTTGNAATVTTNANLTGHVISVGNATVLGSFTKVQLDTAISDANVIYVGDTPSSLVLTSATGLPPAGQTTEGRTFTICGFVADGGGTALTTQTRALEFTVPVAMTLTGYSASCDTGTFTVKFWKIANGTALPTVANVINTSGVGIASGTHLRSTTISDFTTAAFAAGDIVRCAITAVSGATWIKVALEGTKN